MRYVIFEAKTQSIGDINMKTEFFFPALVVALLCSYGYAEYKNIPLNQLESYKTAVVIAGLKSPLSNCKESGFIAVRSLDTYLKKADSGKIELYGKQPILFFENSSVDGRADTKAVTTIITSNDYKSIVSIKVEILQLSDINIGNIRNPHIVKAYEVISSGECN